ncbi:MAG: hypothetical protein GX328_02540 [Clostridiaceae bacterium]|nr:hypothetical protein [Clostridiaceae bacterium]
MNWQKQYQFFEKLTADQVGLFATPRELEQALKTYNHALDLLKSGKQAQAISLLKTVADDFPMFSYASHLYGTVMAAQKDFKQANDYFKKVALLDIDQDQADLLQQQMKLVAHEINLLEHQENLLKKRNTAFSSVKKEISIADILEKAPRKKHVPGANQEEIALINRRLGNEDPADLSGELALENRRANLKFAAIVIAIGGIVFLIFYFGIRPIILSSRTEYDQSYKRLQWLEQEMEFRAEQGQTEIELLLTDYQKKYSTAESDNATGKTDKADLTDPTDQDTSDITNQESDQNTIQESAEDTAIESAEETTQESAIETGETEE